MMALSKQVADALMHPVIFIETNQSVHFNFLKREFRKKSVVKQSFQANWFSKWPYREDNDTVFCHTCTKAFKKMSISVSEHTFISRGFCN